MEMKFTIYVFTIYDLLVPSSDIPSLKTIGNGIKS